MIKTKPEQLADARLEEFRSHSPEGDATEVPAEKVHVSHKPDGRDARISKTVRMRLRYSEMLRDVSYQRTVETGEKVSEADLIDEALMEWRRRHKIIID